MPIGKDSIQKRVAKATEAVPAEEVKTETATAEKKAATPRKRTTSTTSKSTSAGAKKTASTGTKKTTTAKKPSVKAATPKATAPAVEPSTTVLSNVAPETVAAVIGHDEKKPSDKVKIGQKMPTYLL